MAVSTLIRAAGVAARQGRCLQASRLLTGAANRADNELQRFRLAERAYELAYA